MVWYSVGAFIAFLHLLDTDDADGCQHVEEHIDDNDLLTLAQEEGVGVVLWHVMDDGADGIELLGQLLDRFAERARCVVVKNLGRGKDFSAFEASGVRAAELGAPVLELAELHAGTMRKVDHGNLSFWAAANNEEAFWKARGRLPRRLRNGRAAGRVPF
jgi:hypothetical protein